MFHITNRFTRLPALGLTLCLALQSMALGQAPSVEKTFPTAVPSLEVEPVGLHSVRAWHRALTPGRANDQSPWKQLIWFKKDPRTTQKSYFAVVDFESGTVTELPTMIPAMEPWAHQWLDGKLYLGTNLRPHLSVYDPATDTLTHLGAPFEGGSLTLYKIAVSPDGVLVMGGGTGSDVSTYDPKTNTFDHYGQVAAKPGGGTYAYYVSMDENYIYAAVRSSEPWELVRLDRKTKERTVLLTAPPQAFMSLGNGHVNVASKDEAGNAVRERYAIADGAIRKLGDDESATPWPQPGPGFTGEAPQIAIDLSPLIEGDDALAVHIQSPSDAEQWREARLPLRPDVAPIKQLVAMEDGRLVGLPGAYFAMLIVDPQTGATQRVPLTVSTYGLLAVGERIFITGYPTAQTIRFDTTKPMTWEEALPGRPGVDVNDPAANPYRLAYFGHVTGGAHIGREPTLGADGNVYLIARRHRYFYGFDLLWFNPEPNAEGKHDYAVFDDEGAFDHLQISAMQPIDGGEKLLITTHVQHNPQLDSEAPDSAAIFVFDVAEKKILGRYEPLPGAKEFTDALLIEGTRIIGQAPKYHEDVPLTLFRFNIESGELEQTRHYNWGLRGTWGQQSDGMIWGTAAFGNYSVIYTLDPRDLSIKGLGRVEPTTVGMVIDRGQIYLSGYTQIMRVRGLDVPGPAAQR